MCGIFGYVGSGKAAPILLAGLRTLEYRGYDSAGIYIPGHAVIKAVGPIDMLTRKVPKGLRGSIGIAHTRWATHGAPTAANAHPHCDSKETIWLVHNGIIENYQELKTELRAQGYTFQSDTDSEVLATLIASYYRTVALPDAVRSACARVRGTYGMAVMAAEQPNRIVVARLGSPIVLGIGSNEYFVSSDPSALLAHTKTVVYLEDGELAVLTADSYQVSAADGVACSKQTETIAWDVASVQKAGFEHFMLKEIFEAPEVVANTIRGRLIPDTGRIKLGGVETVLESVVALDRLTIAACGSAYLAGYVGKYLLETYANMPVDLELASEYRYQTQPRHGTSALLVVTQSGETADTLAAVRRARELGQMALGIVNVVGSTIARETDAGVYNHAGPEVAVASTKAFISQLTVFVLIAVLLGRERGMSEKEGKAIIEALQTLPETLRTVLQRAEQIESIANKYAQSRDAMFIGRNSSTPMAYEGALKLKEVTYIHAEAYAGGELKHGSIAMLDENFPVIALAPRDAMYEKMLSNIEEVKARKAPVIAFATEGDTQLGSIADDVFFLPSVHPIVQPVIEAVPLHLFAYYVGVAKGLNVDRPRNLAKSVTVE